jgi:hypothetical protein
MASMSIQASLLFGIFNFIWAYWLKEELSASVVALGFKHSLIQSTQKRNPFICSSDSSLLFYGTLMGFFEENCLYFFSVPSSTQSVL